MPCYSIRQGKLRGLLWIFCSSQILGAVLYHFPKLKRNLLQAREEMRLVLQQAVVYLTSPCPLPEAIFLQTPSTRR